jgi:hypothetical protein
VVVGGLKRRDVHYARSLNGGETWEPELNLTRTPRSGSSDQSLAVTASGQVHVVFHDDEDDGNQSWELYYLGSPDRGGTWGARQKLTTTRQASGDGHVNVDLPSVAAGADGTVYVVWQDFRNGLYETFFTWGDGVEWAAEYPLNAQTRANLGPSVATGRDGAVHVLWSGFDGQRDVYYRHLP